MYLYTLCTYTLYSMYIHSIRWTVVQQPVYLYLFCNYWTIRKNVSTSKCNVIWPCMETRGSLNHSFWECVVSVVNYYLFRATLVACVIQYIGNWLPMNLHLESTFKLSYSNTCIWTNSSSNCIAISIASFKGQLESQSKIKERLLWGYRRIWFTNIYSTLRRYVLFICKYTKMV